MKIFLSWSGEKSKRVAEYFSHWISGVLQETSPWISTEDIDSGSIWFSAINNQLSESKTGIIFLTKENCQRPWILFEAGALAKGLESSRVCTFLIDLQPNDIRDPLAQFNGTLPTKDGVKKLILNLNANLTRPLTPETLNAVFENGWDAFNQEIQSILNDFPSEQALQSSSASSTSPSGETIDEILNIVRATRHKVSGLEEMILNSISRSSHEKWVIESHPKRDEPENKVDTFSIFSNPALLANVLALQALSKGKNSKESDNS